ncbi:MAG TPA: histidine phosphatase family protein [Gemmatimonadales bacterium]|nr:histidine phosphatase family protein [Gemmatimonadales bacterium]
MTVTVLLVRHATCDHVGRRIAGRSPGVHLNAQGRAEAAALAEALGGLPVAAVYSAPLERASETAAPLAERLALPVVAAPGLDELDFGDWTGRSLDSLAAEPGWRAFNEARDTTRIPGGELMSDAVARAMAELVRFRREHPDGLVAAVSHGDVIRGVLLHCLGLPLHRVHRLDVAPASVSVAYLSEPAPRVLAVNWTVGRPPWRG